MAMDSILPFLRRFNTRSVWLGLLFLIVLLSSFAHLNLNYQPLSHTQKSSQISYSHPGEPSNDPPSANTLTHSPSYTELAKAPLKIYIPPQNPSSDDPLVDIWASTYHKEQAAAKEGPSDKEAYYKAVHCPVCVDGTSPSSATGKGHCPDFKQMIKNIAAVECSKCAFDVSRCPGADQLPHHTNAGVPASTSLPAGFAKNTRPLISYVYSESPTSHTNLAFFVKHALHDEADFVFILYGNTTVEQDLLPKGHVNINIYKKPLLRESCSPLTAHFELLGGNGGTPLKDLYEHFILVNSEVRGPFIPRWSGSCWSDAFLGLVKDKVKLVGTELACLKGERPHLQPHILATDKQGLAVLMKDKRITTACEVKKEAEKDVTDAMRLQGWDAVVLDMAFKDESQYRYVKCIEDQKRFVGVGMGNSIDGEVDPLEVLFVGAGKELHANGTKEWESESKRLNLLSKRMDTMEYSSYDACRKKVKV